MNIQLEKLFSEHNFSKKDRYDFMQIYNLLPSHKRVKVIESFEEIVSEMNILRNELITEQELLFGKTLENIENKLKSISKNKIVSRSLEEISFLKNTL